MSVDIAQQTIFHSPIWGFVGAVIAIFAVGLTVWIFWLPRQETKIEQQLEDDVDLQKWIDQYSQTSNRQRFRKAIGVFLHRTDKFFGTTYWSTFSRCLTIAFIYPILLLMASWFITGEGAVGGIEIFPDQFEFGWRIFVLVVVFSFVIFTYFEFSSLDKIHSILEKMIWNIPGMKVKSKNPTFRKTVGFLTNTVGVALVGAVLVVFVGNSPDIATILTLCFFYLYMPSVNAAIDSASWQITRLLMRRAEKNTDRLDWNWRGVY